MEDEKKLLDLCQLIVKHAQELGADAVEAHAQSHTELESDVELAQISSVNQQVAVQIAARVFIGKKMGNAFTNIATKEAVREAVEMAINAAKATTDDEDWVSLPSPQDYPDIQGLWFDDVVKQEPGIIVASTGELISKASAAEEGLIVVGGSSGVTYGSAAYANSNGIEHSEKATVSYIVVVAVAKTEAGMTPSVFSYDIRRDLDVDLEKTVSKIADQIRLCKNVVKGKTGKHTVVFHPQAYAQLLNYTLMEGVKGDNVARGKSKIADKIGDTIASKRFSLLDDGLYAGGANTSIADHEGVPRQRTPIVEKGVLKTFLWDTYWANKMGVKSTGNAKRNMRQGLVEIGFTNLVIEPGTREIDDIISEIDHGYYIQSVQGAHSANPESGDFSVVGNPAILIEKGKMIGAINGLMVSGNAFDMLKSIIEVAKTPHALVSWIGPEIICKNIDIIAAEE
ncbi:MAG: TldD/PmbA family protein [Candidatus Thorarchaeota archaeon]|jgi:PmbA protein